MRTKSIYYSFICLAISFQSFFSFFIFASEIEMFQEGIKEYSLIAADEAYYPNKIRVYRGELLRLYLTTTVKHPATQSCFFLEKTNVHVSVNKGEIQEVNIKFEEAGTYPFFCPTQKIKGEIIVVKKQDEVLKEQKVSKSKRQ
jgi:plastocyanin